MCSAWAEIPSTTRVRRRVRLERNSCGKHLGDDDKKGRRICLEGRDTNSTPAQPGLSFFSQTHTHLLLVERVHPLHRCVEGRDHLQKAGLLFTQGVRQQVRRDFDSRLGHGCGQQEHAKESREGHVSWAAWWDSHTPPHCQGWHLHRQRATAGKNRGLQPPRRGSAQLSRKTRTGGWEKRKEEPPIHSRKQPENCFYIS